MARRNEQVTKIDKFIGSKIYCLRKKAKWSRIKISNLIGVTQQQLGKYEIGTNHISAGRLYLIAEVFNIKPEYFFMGLDEYLSDNDAEIQSCTKTSMQRNAIENSISSIIDRVYSMNKTNKNLKSSKANNAKNTKQSNLEKLLPCNGQGANNNTKKDDFDLDNKSLKLDCA